MKLFGSLTALALPLLLNAGTAQKKRTGIYIDSNLTNGDVNKHFTKLLDAGYDTFYLGFYTILYGCQGACLDWTYTLTDDDRTSILSLIHSYNAKIYLAVGGPGEFWEDCIDENYVANCPTVTATNVATFANKYAFDGIEFSLGLSGEGTTNSPYADDGSFRNMTQTLISTVKTTGGFTSDQLAISAAAPYYSRYSNTQMNLDYTLSYFCLANNAANVNTTQGQYAVGTCVLKMFNEVNNYMTYSDCFVQNTYNDPVYSTFGAESSVKEIAAYGVDPSMLMINKPLANNEESVRSGYIDPATLGTWGCQAYNDPTIAWTGGFAVWAWDDYSVYNFNDFLDWTNGINVNCTASF